MKKQNKNRIFCKICKKLVDTIYTCIPIHNSTYSFNQIDFIERQYCVECGKLVKEDKNIKEKRR